MVLREKDYLSKVKKKYLIGTVIWFFIMSAIFGTGYILNKTRNNVFTVFAAVLVLPVAQYATKLIALLKFKDPDIKESEELESIEGNYNIIHSAIIPHKAITMYFSHIIITSDKIYCLYLADTIDNDRKRQFLNKVKAKGITEDKIVFLEIKSQKDISTFKRRIEKSAMKENQQKLSDYTKLITQMMM